MRALTQTALGAAVMSMSMFADCPFARPAHRCRQRRHCASAGKRRVPRIRRGGRSRQGHDVPLGSAAVERRQRQADNGQSTDGHGGAKPHFKGACGPRWRAERARLLERAVAQSRYRRRRGIADLFVVNTCAANRSRHGRALGVSRRERIPRPCGDESRGTRSRGGVPGLRERRMVDDHVALFARHRPDRASLLIRSTASRRIRNSSRDGSRRSISATRGSFFRLSTSMRSQSAKRRKTFI